jgi:formate hydrogenlyase transcriptional activator
VRWIEHVCNHVTAENGAFGGLRGSNRDVTEKKLSEEKLRGAHAEVQRLRERLEADNTYLREQVEPGVEGMIGQSDVLRYVLSRARQVAPTSSTVLLQGETGVGKELVAHAVHNLSPRRDRPLVKLNCAALPPSLVESELFGHEKGAFTGAVAQRKGRFEVANGSTLFLDEIGELPLELQAKLLRVIQEGEFERVGGTATLKTDVRLVTATNRRLDEEVKAGRFREDLWYRLNVFPITVPPLRQRREDIPQLVQHFVEKHCRKVGRDLLQVSQATMQDLQAHDWPGNVRELEAVVERAVITSTGEALRLGDEMSRSSPGASAGTEAPTGGPTAAEGQTARSARSLAGFERDHILATLERTDWRLEGETGAAALLGMNPSTLRSRMRKHGLRRPGPPPGRDA